MTLERSDLRLDKIIPIGMIFGTVGGDLGTGWGALTKCAPRPGASQSGLIPEREQTLSKINNRRRR